MSAQPQLAASSLPAEEIASSEQTLGSNNKDPNDETSEVFRQGEIARLAYILWQQRGCPEGSAERDWQQAEQQLSRSV